MTSFDWYKPEWWQRIAPSTARDTVEVIGLAYSLGASRPGDLLEFISGWNLSPTDLPDRVFGAYPLKPEDVESFLNSADALMPPAVAAARMTRRLIALEEGMNASSLGLNIIDVWRHCHDLMPAGRDHGDHCSCLIECRLMPEGIRALDTTLEAYYEQHHEQPYPECFGSADESFQRTLRPLIRRCLEPQ